MAKISLREYIKEIESLIDRGDTNQAIAHSKHVLKYYPKHIDSYRLLGKAFLEKQKYGDAADIFQRVLSSIPDDFISQIGMSIIREDENNLDAAIWHMERAFEIQPSNKAVQDELRRLYSNRDGVAPPKIRLTRGALVRMYSRGELYTQAIAEIRAALVEDPNRVDLEVILARLYFTSGQKVEATETCSKLISKMPYCYEANRILAEILPGTARAEDEKIFRQRVIDLDPYFAFVSDSGVSSTEIEDDEVQLDYLDYDPSLETEQPDWTQSIGLSWENQSESEKDQINEWFSTENEENKFDTSLFGQSQTKEDSAPEDQIIRNQKIEKPVQEEAVLPDFLGNEPESIPEWMKDAGWDVSSEENLDAQKGFNVSEEDLDTTAISQPAIEIEPADVPEWLQEIAPPTEAITDDTSIESDEKFESLISSLQQKPDKQPDMSKPDEVDWLLEFDSETPIQVENDQDWLQNLKSTPTSASEISSDSILEETPNELSEESEETIEWLSDLEFDNPVIDQSIQNQKIIIDPEEMDSNSFLTGGFNPALFSELTQDSGQVEDITYSSPDQENFTTNDSEESMAWLDALTEKQSADEAVSSKQKDLVEDIPEWIKESLVHQEEEKIIENNPKQAEQIPDWLSGLEIDQPDKEKVITEKQVPDWLQQNEANQLDSIENQLNYEKFDSDRMQSETLDEPNDDSIFVNIEDLDNKEFTTTPTEFPNETIEVESLTLDHEDWSSDSELATTESTQEELIEDVLKEDVKPSISFEDMDLESALAWMEGLAAKHGAEEETLVSKPEDRQEAPPDWVAENIEMINENIEIPEIELFEKAETDLDKTNFQEIETPSWIEELVLTTQLDELESKFDESLSDAEIFDELEVATDTINNPEPEESAILEELMDFTPKQENLQPNIGDQTVPDSEEYISPKERITDSIYEGDLADMELVSESPSTNIERLPAEEVLFTGSDEFKQGDEAVPNIESDLASQPDIIESIDVDEPLPAVTSLTDSSLFDIHHEPIHEISINQDQIQEAKHLLQRGKVEEAISIYNELIGAEILLYQIVTDIQESLNHLHPINIELWQALGDAQMRNNNLQEALDAYTKAEELLT
jgi:cytochrome c-type biogenesis protein CcmH/NrfG